MFGKVQVASLGSGGLGLQVFRGSGDEGLGFRV